MKEIILHLISTKIGWHEKLVFLEDIRDKWLAQPLDLVLCMKAVCDKIPSSVESLDCSTKGYHRKWHQVSTKNLDLPQDVHPGLSISGKHHFPC